MTSIRPADAPKTILIVIGTRPEAIKLFPVIHALQRQPEVRLSICVTGQHGQMVADVLAMAGITPDWDLAALQPGQSLDALLDQRILDAGEADAARQKIARLSNRERQVMQGLLDGLPNKLIAYQLNLSPARLRVFGRR